MGRDDIDISGECDFGIRVLWLGTRSCFGTNLVRH